MCIFPLATVAADFSDIFNASVDSGDSAAADVAANALTHLVFGPDADEYEAKQAASHAAFVVESQDRMARSILTRSPETPEWAEAGDPLFPASYFR